LNDLERFIATPSVVLPLYTHFCVENRGEDNSQRSFRSSRSVETFNSSSGAPAPLGFCGDELLVLNKLFDLAPPALIGLAVDVVVRGKQSLLAGYGIHSVSHQLWVLAFLTFVIWAAESIFEYQYDVLWRNLAQSTQHSLRLEAYDHLQKLELAFFEQDSSGRLLSVLNDDINQLERFPRPWGESDLAADHHRVGGWNRHGGGGPRSGAVRLFADPRDPVGIDAVSASACPPLSRGARPGRGSFSPLGEQFGRHAHD
jgi:hypothetical protein